MIRKTDDGKSHHMTRKKLKADLTPCGFFNRITAILKDERGITGDTAIRLGTFFKTSAEFWMNLQMTYDLRNAEKALPARVRKSIEDNRSVLA